MFGWLSLFQSPSGQFESEGVRIVQRKCLCNQGEVSRAVTESLQVFLDGGGEEELARAVLAKMRIFVYPEKVKDTAGATLDYWLVRHGSTQKTTAHVHAPNGECGDSVSSVVLSALSHFASVQMLELTT